MADLMVNRDVASGQGGPSMDRPSQQVLMLTILSLPPTSKQNKPGCFLGRFFQASPILGTWQASPDCFTLQYYTDLNLICHGQIAPDLVTEADILECLDLNFK